MKLGDFLSDEAKQALSDIRKSHSKVTSKKNNGVQKNGKDGPVSKPKDEKQKTKEYSLEDTLAEIKKKRSERNIRLQKENRRLKKLRKIKYVQEQKNPRRNAIKRAVQRQKDEEIKRTENRLRVKKTHHDYSIETTNSIKAWSIPMGGLNKR